MTEQAAAQIVIAGGGPAGASAACRLARAGRPVTLIERDRAPGHKICGEFISGEALADLAEMGIDVTSLGASRIGAMRLVHRSRVAEGRLPFTAAGLSRLALDEALLRRATHFGADVQRGIRVRSAEPGALQTDAGPLAAHTLLLATGKHDLRGLQRPVAEKPDALVGFKMHFRLSPSQRAALAGHVEIILFRGGYAGLQMVEHDTANLCLLVERARYGGDWSALLGALTDEDAHLARRMEGATACWDRPLTIARVPYGFVHAGADRPGVYRLGDQAAVIPSFCGDGMAIALHSAKLAATAVLAGQTEAAYHRALRRDAGPPVRLAFGLYRLTRAPALRTAVVRAAQAWPGLLASVARRTRVAPPGR